MGNSRNQLVGNSTIQWGGLVGSDVYESVRKKNGVYVAGFPMVKPESVLLTNLNSYRPGNNNHVDVINHLKW